MISYVEPIPTISRADSKVMCKLVNRDSGNGRIRSQPYLESRQYGTV